MRIFVTGATGFIGHHLVRLLLERGHDVQALVRPSCPQQERLHKAAGRTYGDLSNPGALRAGCQRADAVVHCAALVGITDRESQYRQTNVDGTLNLLRAASRAGVPRIVHLSSGSVLGPTGHEPANEHSPLDPRNSYARSKAEAERRAWAMATRYRLPLAIVRPSWVYGPGDSRGLVLFRAVKRGLPMPWKSRVSLHPVHVDDFNEGIISCLEAFPGPVGRTYHLAGATPVAIRTIIRTIAGALGVKPPPHLPAGPLGLLATLADMAGAALELELPINRRRLAFFTFPNAFSIENAIRDFQYHPSRDLADGFRSTAGWYIQRGLL